MKQNLPTLREEIHFFVCFWSLIFVAAVIDNIFCVGSSFPPSRKLGFNVATGSSLFSLGHAWVNTVPAGADVN